MLFPLQAAIGCGLPGKDMTLGSSSAAEASPRGLRARAVPTPPQQWGQQVLRPRRTWTVLTVSTTSAPNGHSILHTILGHNSGRTQVDGLTSASLAGLEGPLTRSLLNPCSMLLSFFPSVHNSSSSGTPLNCMMVWGSSHVLHEGFKSPRSMKTHCHWHSVTLTCLNGPSGHRACPDSRG